MMNVQATLPTPDLLAPAFSGIERDASWVEIRLALAFYREVYGRDHWKTYSTPAGRA